MKDSVCYVDGSFVPIDEAKVSVLDRGFTSGEGVYDVTRSYGHKLFKLDAHIQRLYRSLNYTFIDCGIPLEEMTRLSNEVFDRNKHLLGPEDDAAIWQVVSRGALRFGAGDKRSTVVIFAVPVAFESFARNYLDGLKLMTPSTRRTPPQCLEAKAKICNKMNHVIVFNEAQQVDPKCVPLMLDLDGNISRPTRRTSSSSPAASLYTSTDRNVLQGVTRATVFELAAELWIPSSKEFHALRRLCRGRGFHRRDQPDHDADQEPERHGDRQVAARADHAAADRRPGTRWSGSTMSARRLPISAIATAAPRRMGAVARLTDASCGATKGRIDLLC